jgi:hypothetical protein
VCGWLAPDRNGSRCGHPGHTAGQWCGQGRQKDRAGGHGNVRGGDRVCPGLGCAPGGSLLLPGYDVTARFRCMWSRRPTAVGRRGRPTGLGAAAAVRPSPSIDRVAAQAWLRTAPRTGIGPWAPGPSRGSRSGRHQHFDQHLLGQSAPLGPHRGDPRVRVPSAPNSHPDGGGGCALSDRESAEKRTQLAPRAVPWVRV